MADPRAVVEAYWAAEMARDLEEILAHYQDDAELVVPDLGRLVGHREISRFYSASIESYPRLEVEIVRAIVNGASGAFEWSSVHHDYAGSSYPCSGVNIVDVVGDKMQRVHVYYDPRIFSAH